MSGVVEVLADVLTLEKKWAHKLSRGLRRRLVDEVVERGKVRLPQSG